uniref:Uncharacterized protein n=1 Tax=Sus scrofa TaxID=9823 RepID=A0A4X1UW44_PIG
MFIAATRQSLKPLTRHGVSEGLCEQHLHRLYQNVRCLQLPALRHVLGTMSAVGSRFNSSSRHCFWVSGNIPMCLVVGRGFTHVQNLHSVRPSLSFFHEKSLLQFESNKMQSLNL